MNSQKQVISLIKSMSGQANVLTVPRVYVDILKSHRAALLLSQCVYWSDKTEDPDGWFYKTFSEWRDELGMNQHAVETARKSLEEHGFIHTKISMAGKTHKNHWRVNFERLTECLTNHLAETAMQDLAETANHSLAENAMPSISKITPQEITTSAEKNRAPSPRPEKRAEPEEGKAGTRAIQDSYEKLLGYAVPDWSSGEAASAKWIGERYTVIQFELAYKKIKGDKFWREKRVTLKYVKGQIGEFFNGNKPGSDDFAAARQWAEKNGVEWDVR